jgi:formylglycine-generating enzyme required for sulfatase activity
LNSRSGIRLAEGCRVAYRGSEYPYNRYDNVGFRLVLVL